MQSVTLRNFSNLDGLRGFACLLVLFSHYFPHMLGAQIAYGRLGVGLFFSLSGFLMSYHYLPGNFSWRYWGGFALRRFFRVYPAFFVVLLLYGILHSATDFHMLRPFDWRTVFNHWLLIDAFGRFWTIRSELGFYAWFPAIAMSLLLLPGKLRLAALCAGWLAIYCGPFTLVFFLLLPNMMSYFIGGLIAGELARFRWLRAPALQPLWDAGSLAAIALILASPYFLHIKWLDLHNILLHTKALCPLMAFVVISLAHARGAAQRFFSHPVMRFTGHISFSLYLIFGPAYIITGYYLPNWQNIVAGPAAGLGTAFLLYRYVELPGNALGKRLSKPLLFRGGKKPPAAISTSR